MSKNYDCGKVFHDKAVGYVKQEILCIKSYIIGNNLSFIRGEFYKLYVINYNNDINNYISNEISVSFGVSVISYPYKKFIEHFRLINEQEYLAELRKKKIDIILDD